MGKANLDTPIAGASTGQPVSEPTAFPSPQVVEQVRQIIERIRPAIQLDGGDLEFVGLTESGVVQVRLHGACVGCPSSSVTLQMGVERALRERVPGVTKVEAVDS